MTELGGGWTARDAPITDVLCPHIQVLWATHDHIPCSALPNLLCVNLYRGIPAAVLVALSQYCCRLQSIRLSCLPDTPTHGVRTVHAGHASDRVAALRSLTNLQHLVALDYAVTDDSELLALAHVAALLARHELRELTMLVQDTAAVSDFCLIGFGQLSGLGLLHVWLLKPGLMWAADPSRAFVSVLAGVRDVQLVVVEKQQHISLSNAFKRAEVYHLPLPGRHTITVLS